MYYNGLQARNSTSVPIIQPTKRIFQPMFVPKPVVASTSTYVSTKQNISEKHENVHDSASEFNPQSDSEEDEEDYLRSHMKSLKNKNKKPTTASTKKANINIFRELKRKKIEIATRKRR